MKRTAVFGLICFFAASLQGASRPQYAAIYLRNGYAQPVAVSGSALVVRYYYETYSNRDDLSVRLYRVPLGVRVDWMRSARSSVTPDDLRTLELVRTLTAVSSEDGNYFLQTADFGVQRNGEYLAVWNDGRGSLDGRIYEVGSLGTVWHAAGPTLLVYAVDLRTFKRRSDVRYSVWRAQGHNEELVTFDGLARSAMGGFQSAILYGRAGDGSQTVQRIWDNDASPDVGYIQTDRPIYRTGQHVYARAVLRSGSIGAYLIPHGKVTVAVRDQDGTALYEGERTLTRFGTVAVDVAIPDSARLGYYQITIGKITAGFDVQEYKKPEYALSVNASQAFVVGGDTARFAIDAKYFFGRPAAGMNLRYSGTAQYFYDEGYNPYSFLGNGYRYDSQAPSVRAQGVADGNGHLEVAVPTKHVDYEQTFYLQVDGRDASGRTVSTGAAARIVPASFRVDLAPDRWYAELGEDVNISATARDYDTHVRPNQALQVEVQGTHWDYHTHIETKLPVAKRTLMTDGQGRATFHWHPERAASYELTFSGRDERGNKTQSSLWFWVSSSSHPWWFPGEQMTMIPDKASYLPGERPKILLTAPQTDADAVLMVTSDRIVSARVIHVGAKPQTITVDSPKDASYYTVRVEIPGKHGLTVAQTAISVSPAPRILNLTLRPNKAKYAPGERATFRLSARDLEGRPVRAEIGIGVVDEALYAVQGSRGLPVFSRFYDLAANVSLGPSWNRVDNEAVAPVAEPTPSRALKEIGRVSSRGGNYLIKPGTTADVYSVHGAAGNASVRNFFADTAFWKPDVRTDVKGNATVSFVWPDSLTTWRVSGVAVDMDTSVGSGANDALVTKDFLVRLEMPRFLRRGDRSQFTGIVNGRAGSKSAFLRLDAGDLQQSASEQTVAIDSNASGNAVWNINPLTSLGNREITLRGSDGVLSDAMRLTIPIQAAGAPEHVRDAGEARNRSTVTLAVPSMYDAGALHIAISPSVVASLLQNVRMLDVYPYYCVEQTMSAALPDIFLERVAKRMNVALPGDAPQASAIIKKAVARLRVLQHPDGSWGWWEHDNAHPFMTAYALYGLAEFRKSGYAVPAQMYDAGVASLLTQLQTSNDDTLRLWGGRQPRSQWNTRAFMLFSLANAAPERMNHAILAQTMAHLDDLNDYALAVLGLAQHELGNDRAAHALLDRLNSHMIQTDSYGYWLSQTWHYAWQDDPIEATAYALRLNDALDPQSARVSKVVSFLRSQQHGGWWYTTKDTAAAVYAIAEAEHAGTSEYHPDETVDVYLNDKRVGHVHITKPVLNEQEASIDVAAADLQGGGTVRFAVSGIGLLYWSTDWTRYAPPYARKIADAEQSMLSRLRAQASTFTIVRTFSAPHTPWQVGDEVSVETTVSVRSDADYVAIEDPFAAGVEYNPDQGEGAQTSWSGLQFFDDRLVFFADHLYADYPLHLHYKLRVTTPGTYTAAPPIAYAMYGPPISAVGRPDKITIK